MAEYDEFAKYYELEYGHKDNDLDFYLEMAQNFGGPILEIGVGTGRMAFELAAQGYDVQGIDNSLAMLRVAEEKLRDMGKVGSHVKLIHADMRFFFLGKKFPLCIIPFRGFLHNLTLDEQMKSLLNIKKHLVQDGFLIFDLFVPLYDVMAKEVWYDKIEPEELAEPDSGITVDVKVEHQPAEQLLTIQNSYIDNKAKSTQIARMKYRYIFRYEMEALLRCAGYTVKNVFGGFEKQPYDFKSGIMIFIAQNKSR